VKNPFFFLLRAPLPPRLPKTLPLQVIWHPPPPQQPRPPFEAEPPPSAVSLPQALVPTHCYGPPFPPQFSRPRQRKLHPCRRLRPPFQRFHASPKNRCHPLLLLPKKVLFERAPPPKQNTVTPPLPPLIPHMARRSWSKTEVRPKEIFPQKKESSPPPKATPYPPKGILTPREGPFFKKTLKPFFPP